MPKLGSRRVFKKLLTRLGGDDARNGILIVVFAPPESICAARLRRLGMFTGSSPSAC